MYKKRLLLVLLLLAATLIVTACSVRIVRGSGDVTTETRQVSNFDSIALSGSGEVIITQGGSESLTIETDNNVMEYVTAKVEGRTLKLGFKPGVNIMSYTRLVFNVGVDDLIGLTISGSGNIESDTLETDRLDAKISGSGDIQIAGLTVGEVRAEISGSGEVELAGEASAQDVSISGSGHYQAGDVCSASVKVNISGSGGATVCATETLDSNISGSGSVGYYGHPSINSSDSGSGNINNLGDK